MSKTTIWIIIASAFVVIGIILFVLVLATNNWDFSKLSTSKFVENSYVITEDFKNISINTETADISFVVTNNGKCRVDCYEEENNKHSVNVEKDTLNIKLEDKERWSLHIGINFEKPKLTVYLPKSVYNSLLINESTGDVKIPADFKFEKINISASTGKMNVNASASDSIKVHTSTGAIYVEDISANSLDVSASTGIVSLSNVICNGDIKADVTTGISKLTSVKCENLTSSGSTGEIVLNNVIAKDKLSIKRSTGNVVFDSSDANEIYVKTSTGKVSGTLLTDKVFITDTSTGSINVPKTITGGRCEIKTATGNINIDIK